MSLLSSRYFADKIFIIMGLYKLQKLQKAILKVQNLKKKINHLHKKLLKILLNILRQNKYKSHYKMLVLTVLAIVQLLVNNAACQEQTCTITKMYSCDEYRHSSGHAAVGKMGPRGLPGKDCNLTSVKEHLRRVQNKLNKTKQGWILLK